MKRRPPAIHPFLFAAYPVLFLFFKNIYLLSIKQLFVPLFVALTFAAALLLIMKPVFGDYLKAGVFSSVVLILFFSYGAVYTFLEPFHFGGSSFFVGPKKLTFLVMVMPAAVGFFLVRRAGDPVAATRLLNITALCLILISPLAFGAGRVKVEGASNRPFTPGHTEEKTGTVPEGSLPDIYYIILDGYGGADILKQLYSWDNKEFLDYLSRKGFHVVPEARTNYPKTVYSLAASLNFSYQNDLSEDFKDVPEGYLVPIIERLQDNKVFRILKDFGYKNIVISSHYLMYGITHTDTLLKKSWSADEFQNSLINYTPVPALLDFLRFRLIDQYRMHRERIHYMFSGLKTAAEFAGPTFVYAHIMSPHPPFVFGPNGEAVQPDRGLSTKDGKDYLKEGGTVEEYLAGYKAQIQYVNKKMIETIDFLLSRPGNEPIIVIQGDHGPRITMDFTARAIEDISAEGFSILNAYYLPEGGAKNLHQGITPVNTFRIIFNTYFNGKYPLLPDKCYFITKKSPFVFHDVTDAVRKN